MIRMFGFGEMIAVCFLIAASSAAQESKKVEVPGEAEIMALMPGALHRLTLRLSTDVLKPYDLISNNENIYHFQPMVGAPTDPKDAEKWYEPRAQNGKVRAMVNYGVLLESRVKPDTKAALHWYGKAAALEDEDAMANIARIYACGWYVPKNLPLAVEWQRKAAQKGHVNSIFNLAVHLAEGSGTPKNVGEALEWYRLAAQKGSTWAMFNMALIYERGIDTTKDETLANEWYERAIGQRFGMALYNVAVRDISSEDPSKRIAALENLQKAASWFDSRAAFSLATMQAEGLHVPKDPESAVKNFTIAAEWDEPSMNYLGILALRDEKDPKHFDAAMKWFRKAAKSDDPIALVNIAAMLLRGQGVKRSPEEAIRRLQLAAEAGEGEAMAIMATAHVYGFGIKQDAGAAYAWFSTAIESGIKDAGGAFVESFRQSATKKSLDDADALKANYMRRYVAMKQKK